MRNVFSLCLVASLLCAQTKTKDNPADWPMYTRDLAGTRYSPLKQINTGNVTKLTAAWNYKLRAAAAPSGDSPAAAEQPAAPPGDFAQAAAGDAAPARGGRWWRRRMVQIPKPRQSS